MARMLSAHDSTDTHLSNAQRHQRLARRYRLEGLVTAIQPTINALNAAAANATNRQLERQGAYDELVAADADLDDTIRNLYNSAEISDRENPGANILRLLFPGGGYTSVTEESMTNEPAVADALATRLETLGANHPLASHATKIRTLTAAVRKAITDQESAIRAAKSADAEEEIAQAALRRQYEANYLEARKTHGRAISDRLFPVRSDSSAKKPVNPAPAHAPTQ